MARYGDLYTPASNYGRVYRGSLASRQKSVEQAGQNMKDFAGEIYNLVDRQRQAKLAQEEQKSLERERASVQAARKARTEREAEQARFNKWITKLNSAVGLHKDEQAQIDRRVYKKYGGLQPTIKAYREMREGFERRIAAATSPAERRTIYMQYRDIFDDFIKPGSIQPDQRDENGVYRIGDDTIMAGFAMMPEQKFVQRMKSDDPGDNKYQPLIRALLSDPEWGVGFAVKDADDVAKESRPATKLNEEPNAVIALADKGKATEVTTSETPDVPVISDEIQTGSLNPRRETTGQKLFGKEGVGNEMGDDSTEEYTGQQGTESDQAGTGFSENVMESNLGAIQSSNPWLVTSTDNQGLAVNEMLNGIGLYLRSQGREDTYQERARVFNSFKNLRDIMSGKKTYTASAALSEYMNSNVGRYLKSEQPGVEESIKSLLSKNWTKAKITRKGSKPEEGQSTVRKILIKLFQRK